MATLTTVGYGDVVAQNGSEIGANMAWMIVGVAFYSYVISTLTSTLVSQDVKKTLVENRLKQFIHF